MLFGISVDNKQVQSNNNGRRGAEKGPFWGIENLNPLLTRTTRQTRGFYSQLEPVQKPRVCRSGAHYGAIGPRRKSKFAFL